jgi:hypothetical protein
MYREACVEHERLETPIGRDIRLLILQLCMYHPQKRMGAKVKGMKEMRDMLMFKDLDWSELELQGEAPPYKPDEDPDGIERFLEEEEENGNLKNFSGSQSKFEGFGAMLGMGDDDERERRTTS